MPDNPFTLLAFIGGPAILTNASCLLALNTANRYGRAFDRAKEVGRELEHAPCGEGLAPFRLRLLSHLIARAALLLRAQTAFYRAVAPVRPLRPRVALRRGAGGRARRLARTAPDVGQIPVFALMRPVRTARTSAS
jgi:hypothetical protein